MDHDQLVAFVQAERLQAMRAIARDRAHAAALAVEWEQRAAVLSALSVKGQSMLACLIRDALTEATRAVERLTIQGRQEYTDRGIWIVCLRRDRCVCKPWRTTLRAPGPVVSPYAGMHEWEETP